MHNEGSCKRPAPGGPGIEPRWTRSSKDAIGTAYSTDSRLWYTLSAGVLDEVYYPTIDKPQIRDLQYLITDGETFFSDERHLETEIEALTDHALGVRVTGSDPASRYRIIKEIVTNPHQPCLLVHTWLEAEPVVLDKLKLFVLCAPHLEGGGWNNNAQVLTIDERKVFSANKQVQDTTWLALSASIPFVRCSVGYVGVNDGWTDLHDNLKMDWEYDCATQGNIALMGEIDLSKSQEFTLGLAFGTTFHSAVTVLFQSLGIPFKEHRERFVDQWERICEETAPLERVACDGGALYHRSKSLLLAHEDKTYHGAMIASLSIPWGEAKSDEDGIGGYHLVWTRDMVQSATAMLAMGNTGTPLRSLIYLAIAQLPDGGFYQNFWLNGDANWTGVQLDEVAFPIILAWRLHNLNALKDFDPYEMVRLAAGYLIRHGPVTPQERWEENSGYSPSTLAVNIAALTLAAMFMHERGDKETAAFVQEFADFLECHIEAWTVTTQGTLVPGISKHYIRINPADPNNVQPGEDPNRGVITIANRAPWEQTQFPAKNVVDAGFLELVRYGIRRPDDPIIVDSLRVVDEVLKVEFEQGTCWHRYNHDGYGQRPDGGPFETWGQGRPWPLLTGERGHYELAAGHPVEPYIKAIEDFAYAIGLLTEQLWDQPDMPEEHLFFGKPTDAAMPLMWAHAEYIKLLRSVMDGQAFDYIPEVAQRYSSTTGHKLLEIWKVNRQIKSVRAGWVLRVQVPAPFVLHWTDNEWQDTHDDRSIPTSIGIEFVDINVAQSQQAPVRFTFHWVKVDKWEGKDYEVSVKQ